MNAMPILILPPRNAPDAAIIRDAALAAGWKVEQLTSWRAPGSLRGHDLVLYGEPLFADVITPALDLALLEAPAAWLPSLPERYSHRSIRLTALREAMALPDSWFVKPAEDKCFPAGVYASGADLPATVHALPESTPVLLSEPVKWEVEYRCFVLDRQVLTHSPYVRHGALAQAADGSWPALPGEQEDALAFAAAFLADPAVPLPTAVVIDVGRMAGRGWAVVESNGAWGSGLYGCDPARVLRVLARATRTGRTLLAEDRPWVRQRYVVEPAPAVSG
jgi:hypothetical protein